MKKIALVFLFFSIQAQANGFQSLSEEDIGGRFQPAVQGNWGQPGLPTMDLEGGPAYSGVDGLSLPDGDPRQPQCFPSEDTLELFETIPVEKLDCSASPFSPGDDQGFTTEFEDLTIEESQILRQLYDYLCRCQ